MRRSACRRFRWLQLFFGWLLALGLVACSAGPGIREGGHGGGAGRLLWESGQQYVRLVSNNGLADNQHPVTFTAQEIRVALESLAVSEPGLIQTELHPVFSPGEIQVLSAALSRGLAIAGPHQDIIFLTIGAHPGLFTQAPKVTTGRVFFQDGKLNMIFGLLHYRLRETDLQTGAPIDRRLHPWVVGSRLYESDLSASIALKAGQAFYVNPKTGEKREDWVVLDMSALLSQTRSNSRGEPARSGHPEEAARSRREIQRRARGSAESGRKGPTMSIEARFRLLKELYEKGLITREEYRRERRELLEQL